MPVAEMKKGNYALTEEEILKFAKKIERNNNEDINFSNKIDEYISGKLKPNEVLKLGTTPFSLRAVGAKAIPLVITQGTVANSMHMENAVISNNNKRKHTEAHDIPPDVIKELPQAIRNPMLICKGNIKDSLVIITDLKGKNDKSIYAAIRLNVKGQNGYVNKITTAVEKNNLENWINKFKKTGGILAINKEKAVEMHLDKRVQSPQSTAILCFDNSISYTDQNVKTLQDVFTEKTQFPVAIDLQVGDKIQYNGEKYTVTSLKSDVPNSIQITQQSADGLDYTYHIDKDKLLSHSSFVYLKDDKNAEFEYLKNTEMAMEDDYNSIDGIINNGKRDERPEINDNEQRQQTVYPQKKGNMYINADYYKALSANERKVHTLSSEAADNLMKKLSEQNIPFSAVRNGDKTRVTVSKANESIVSEIISTKESKYINPDFYKSLDKSERYTQRMDEKSAKKIVGELARNGIEHSAVINGNKSAITIKQSDYSKAKNFTISRDFLKKRSVEKHNIPSNEQDRTKNKNRGGRE